MQVHPDGEGSKLGHPKVEPKSEACIGGDFFRNVMSRKQIARWESGGGQG